MKHYTLRQGWWMVLLGCTALLWACDNGDGSANPAGETPGPEASPEPGPGDPGAVFASPQPQLIWKKQVAMELDLSRALSLDRESLCSELDLVPCVDLHEVPLGGNDPFILGLYEPVTDPQATTPTVMDRLLLGACAQAVNRDMEADSPEVFTDIDLGASDLTEATDAVEAQITALYRRFLVRDPLPEEIAIVSRLTVDDDGEPVSASDFAKLSCFTIGSTSEFIFY